LGDRRNHSRKLLFYCIRILVAMLLVTLGEAEGEKIWLRLNIEKVKKANIEPGMN